MIFPVLATIAEGLTAAWTFLRHYRWQSLGLFVAYLASGALGASGVVHFPLPTWLSGMLSTWLLSLLVTVVLAPVWTALFRFAVIGDRGRSYRQWDVRTRRVLGAMAVLAVVSLLGAVPFALGLDILPRMGPRRVVALGAISFAALVKLGAFWLNARLAIAPAMAAAGTKPQALDTSFAYTRRGAFGVLVTGLVVYLPVICITASFMLATKLFDFTPGSGEAIAFAIANVTVSTLMAGGTDLVWGAVCGRMALTLVKAQRARAAAAAKRAKEGRDDDD
jgi:hypothetical protein